MQITDENGFEQIYVAALRSVGIGARLNLGSIAEILDRFRMEEFARLFSLENE